MIVDDRFIAAGRSRLPSRFGWSAVLALALACTGCEANQSDDGKDDKGSGGMFGFFRGSKPSRTTTEIAAEVGAVLAAASPFPAHAALPPTGEFGSCRKLAIDGVPPAAKLLDEPIRGQTAKAYRVDGVTGQPPLVLANIRGDNPRIDMWELGDGDRFAVQRPLLLEAAQPNWVGFLMRDLACLPQRRLLLSVSYTEPEPREALYVYDIAGETFTKLGRVAPDPRYLHHFFEVQPIAADSAITLYFSDVRRLGPERYVNQYNHLRLHSPRFPQGLALLKLGLDDGNIERWTIVDKTLWLDTVDARDPRQPKRFTWSLDLSKVL
ncbi:hypothetical protein [Nevskia sp.]|uniref:hypothetical protein n=1 Tax=Nevskia sp. TaxID=1929292 RepID=UPI0025F33CF9|nr:hypothetical protein [Nevskia sp.]